MSINFTDLSLSPEFRNMLAAAIGRPLRYSEFCEMPAPKGCTHKEIWRFLISVQHIMGDRLGVKPWFYSLEKDECWYYLPKTTQQDLDMLTSLASTESHYNRYLLTYKHRDQEFLPFVYSEIAVLAKRDGFAINERQVYALWNKIQTPRTPEDRIVANFAEAFYAIEKLIIGNFFTRVLIAEIHGLLIKGVGEVELPARPFFDSNLGDPGRLKNPQYVSDSLDILVDNARNARTMKDIIILACELSQCLWDMPYVPSLRNLTEYLIRRAFFLIKELPILSYAPFANKLSLVGLESLEAHEQDYIMYSEEGLNCSFMYSAGIQAYLESVVDLGDTIDAIERSQGKQIERLNSMGSLNSRQKTFAISLLRNPKQDFKIQDYIDLNDVAYATARQDLLAMVDMGLLSMHKEGKAFVFRGITH